MAVKTVKLNQLSKELGMVLPNQISIVKQAVFNGCLQSVSVLVEKSPVDTGQYASSWDVIKDEISVTLLNYAPHASVIENGARPFTPPLEPLLQWAKRVLQDSSQPPDYSKEVRSLAFSVQRKIKLYGMLPKKILTNEMPNILERIKKELIRLGN